MADSAAHDRADGLSRLRVVRRGVSDARLVRRVRHGCPAGCRFGEVSQAVGPVAAARRVGRRRDAPHCRARRGICLETRLAPGRRPTRANPGILVYALVFAVWVSFAAVHPNWIAGHIPGVRYLAERSYAIYLLHLEVITAIRHLPPMPFAVTLGLVWIGGIAVAEVLFRMVERPGMELRERFASTRSTSPGI